MSLSRIHRMLRLLTLLQSGRAATATDLTLELGVSRRTLFRDLKALQEAGVPCYYEAGMGYRIARSFFLPPVNLTVTETLGLLLMGKMAASRRGLPLRDASLGAINKLTSSIPEPIRSACADLMSGVSVNPGPQPFDDKEHRYYADLQKCIDEKRQCQIHYKSPVEPQPIQCRLKPYAMHFVTRAWYVFGVTDLYKKQVRVFKLARIVGLDPLESRFERPGRYKVGDTVGKAWRLIPEGSVYRVELEFTPKVATNVTEVLWHPSQCHRFLPDGRCRMNFEVDGLGEIAWWLCGYAGQVVVLKPAALRNRVKQMLQEALDRYA